MSVGKIILKSTTRISLNDRFTVLRREKPIGQGAQGQEERRLNIQASRRNQRLAAQMERRPAVMAALKLKKKPQQKTETFTQKRIANQQAQRPTIKQRLAIKGRLSLPTDNLRNPNIRSRGGIRGLRGAVGNFRGNYRGGQNFLSNRGTSSMRGGNVSRGNYSSRGFSRGGFSSRGSFSRGGFSTRGTRGGMRTNMRGGKIMRGGGRGGVQGRGGARGGFRAAGKQGGQNQGAIRNTRGQSRGGRGGRGGRRGRGGSNMQNGNFTREQLDQQLDEYMSKTNDEDQLMNDISV